MNTNNDNNLKPGDRVILTEWRKEYADSTAMEGFEIDGHKFPVCATAHIFHDGIYILIDEQVCENGCWSIGHFTYEKIQDDGNG